MITDDFVNQCLEMLSKPGVKKPYLSTLRSMGNILGSKKAFYRPILGNLNKIETKTLIIWGKQDQQILLKHAYIAQKGIKGSQLAIIDNCGHMPHYEQSEEFNKTILKFLS